MTDDQSAAPGEPGFVCGNERLDQLLADSQLVADAASASAVVPGLGQLLHGNRPYLVITLFIGLAAFAAGVQMLITASGVGLAVMMAAMAVLWIIATILPTRAWSKAPRRLLRTGPCRSVLRDGSAPAS